MAKLYGPMYAEIWRQALCLPGYDDLFESLAAEIAAYSGISEVKAQRLVSVIIFCRRWIKRATTDNERRSTDRGVKLKHEHLKGVRS